MALTGAKACKCNSDSCDTTYNIPIFTPAHINSTYKHPPAQVEIGRVGASTRADAASARAPGATAAAQRTEMRGDNIYNTMYGHMENCGKMGDRGRVGTVVRFVRESGLLEI